MNKIIFTSLSLLGILLLSMQTSCSSCTNSKVQETTSKVDFESLQVIDSVDAVFYALPSPEEIISYISSEDVYFDPNLLCPTDHLKLYNNSQEKSVAVGVYLTDIAYISTFKKNNYLGSYVGVVNSLLSDLDINPNFTPEQQELLYNSAFDSESLYAISRELYDVIINYFEDFDDGKSLALIFIGSLTESIYISTQLNSDYQSNEQAIIKIAEQKLVFDDLKMIIEPYKNGELKEISKDLEQLEDAFNRFTIHSEVSSVKSNNVGSISVEGQNAIDIGEDSYEQFKQAVYEFRAKIIK